VKAGADPAFSRSIVVLKMTGANSAVAEVLVRKFSAAADQFEPIEAIAIPCHCETASLHSQ
jgi:hypothetical protein